MELNMKKVRDGQVMDFFISGDSKILIADSDKEEIANLVVEKLVARLGIDKIRNGESWVKAE